MRPHPLLVDLAAGRIRAWDGNDGGTLLASAHEHRMTGLLWSHATEVGLDRDGSLFRALEDIDIRNWSRQQLLRSGLVTVTRFLSGHGIRVAVLKGAPAEDRWYSRTGERPSQDIDLWLHPDHRADIEAIVELLHPGHPIRGIVAGLVEKMQVTEVELWVEGVPVDLHLDPWGMGLYAESPELIWDHVVDHSVQGTTVAVLDGEAALVNHICHLHRDSFRRLLGYADIVRLVSSEKLDWDSVETLVRAEGMQVIAQETLNAVETDLGVGLGQSRPGLSPRRLLFRQLWRPSVRMWGDLATRRFSRRQLWQPFLLQGRMFEAVRWWLRRVFPSRVLANYYAGLTGETNRSYFRSIISSRVRKRRAKDGSAG